MIIEVSKNNTSIFGEVITFYDTETNEIWKNIWASYTNKVEETVRKPLFKYFRYVTFIPNLRTVEYMQIAEFNDLDICIELFLQHIGINIVRLTKDVVSSGYDIRAIIFENNIDFDTFSLYYHSR